jgi:hypothetical protein
MKRLAGLLATGNPEREVAEFAPATMICFSYEDFQWKIAGTLAPRPN